MVTVDTVHALALTFDCLSELIRDVLHLEEWVRVILVVFLQGNVKEGQCQAVETFESACLILQV